MTAAVCGAVSCTKDPLTGSTEVEVPAIDLSNLDTTVSAAVDFYKYATGGWQKNHPLKKEYSIYGSFDVLEENNEIRLNDLFKELSSQKNIKGSEAQKIADLYNMGLDAARLNADGASPAKPYLDEIERISNIEDYFKVQARFDILDILGIYDFNVDGDMKDSKNNVLYIEESGMGLKNRDYFLLPEHEAIRKGYRDFLENIFSLAGYEDAALRADDAFAVNMAIAVPYWSMVQQRDVVAQYNPMSSEQLCAEYPNLHFDLALEAAGIPEQQKLILKQPSYFKAINEMMATAQLSRMKHYLQAQLLSSACDALSDDFYTESFEFFSRQISGIQEMKPRWKRAMALPNSSLSEAVGQLYVEKYFSEKDKEHVLEIVKNIQNALSEHIDSLSWMGDQTKAKAQEKLSAFSVKIGYPDKWKDYSTLDIDPSLSYLDNKLRIAEWYSIDGLSKLGKPVDKGKWLLSPQTVNAYNNPTTNEICFPAAILQPPFYNRDADDAVNYGAIGVVISHEMIHGFDDQGRQFDKDGNMINWWTDADAQAFAEKTAILVDQFNKVEVLPGVFANGSATLGENIADQGGLRVAYSAMENSFGGVSPAPIDGFTASERFYLSYATIWAQNITREEMQRRVLVDEHSLAEHRVNVTLKNIDTFFKAFGIKEGDPMFRPESERVIIW